MRNLRNTGENSLILIHEEYFKLLEDVMNETKLEKATKYKLKRKLFLMQNLNHLIIMGVFTLELEFC